MDLRTLRMIIEKSGGDTRLFDEIINCANDLSCVSTIDKILDKIVDDLSGVDDVNICIAALDMLSQMIDPATAMALTIVSSPEKPDRDFVITMAIMVHYAYANKNDIDRVKEIVEKHIDKLDRLKKIMVVSALAQIGAMAAYGPSTRVVVPLAVALIRKMNESLRNALRYLRETGIFLNNSDIEKATRSDRLFAG